MITRDTLMIHARMAETELTDVIIPFWCTRALNKSNGGFYGMVRNDGTPVKSEPQGALVCGRILYGLSAAARATGSQQCLDAAQKIYMHLDAFRDTEHGGYHWAIDENNKVIEPRKEVYVQLYILLGLSEYFRLTHDTECKDACIGLFDFIDTRCTDTEGYGFIDKFTPQWQRLPDSQQGRSLETHLHALETCTPLVEIVHTQTVRQRLSNCLDSICTRILDPHTFHTRHFFDLDWNAAPDTVAYGHDIETSWLLYEAAQALGDRDSIERCGSIAVRIADTVRREAFDKNSGGIFNRMNSENKKEWWPQAEACVGFLNAYQISGDERFYDAFAAVWHCIDTFFSDKRHGEWYSTLDKTGAPDSNSHKLSQWKGPYHTVRTCVEIMNRTTQLCEKLN
jgi:mannobiose 2-epimerase